MTITKTQLPVKKARVGLIGYRNHAERLTALIEAHSQGELVMFYHPTKDLAPLRSTNKLGDLLELDAVVIASPSETHAEYLRFLAKEFKGYIFCEKPMVTRQEDLEFLKGVPVEVKQRIFVNYNYRYSALADLFDELQKNKIYGEVLSVTVNTAIGLAFKPGYPQSWRADGVKNLHAVTETVAVHYIDLLNAKLGAFKSSKYVARNIAKTGTSFDTSTLFLEYDKAVATIFSSYAAPYLDEVKIVLTNALVTVQEGVIRINHPREVFDAKGFFVPPPVHKETQVSLDAVYEESLARSMDEFLNYVTQGRPVPAELFDLSIKTNEVVLDIQKGV